MAEQIHLGMTREMVLESWGRPRDVNRTTSAAGVWEQWVYGGGYVYFTNGRVSVIQN